VPRNILAALTVALLMTFTATPVSASLRIPGCPVPQATTLAIAHATGKADAPENSLPGIATSATKGATWVEIDVRWNKSNLPVALHNPDVDTTTDGTGLLNTYWLPAINDLDAADYGQWDDKNANGSWVYPQFHGTYIGAGNDVKAVVHPPYGWEFFNAANVANVNLLLDVKETPTEEQAANLYQYIDSFNYESRVIFQASGAAISAMRSFGYTNIKYFMIENLNVGTMRTGESLLQLGASGYSINWPNVTPDFVNYYHAYCIKVFTWTTNSAANDVPANWSNLVNAGVDAIISDQHEELRATL
jgi:glycerophosphoryl diester phosphodiesterase